jgi:hypothetical protein
MVKVLQAGEKVWLVLAEEPLRIRFVIEYAPAVHQVTGETLMMYRVDHWVLKRADRWPLGFYKLLQQAIDAAARDLGMPTFLTPVTAPDGTIVTPAEQRARWQAGLDPRTGQPAPTHSA